MKQKKKTLVTTLFWQDATKAKPVYDVEVLVTRKYKRHWKESILLAFLHKKKAHGVAHGHSSSPGITFDDYWSFPSIATYETVIFWKYTRSPITIKNVWKVIKALAGFGSVEDESICLTYDMTGIDLHDYKESAGGDGEPDHFREYQCSVCKHKFKI